MLPHPVLPFLRELLDCPPVHADERGIEAAVLPDVAVELQNAPLAVALGEKAVDAAADRVDEPAVGIRQLWQRRQAARDRHIAQHHFVAAVLARGKEFGQSFRPPQRNSRLPETRVPRERLHGETQLKDVHQLVTDGVPELGVAAAERECDPALQKLGDAEQAFGGNERQDVRLLEVRMRCIHDQGDAARDGMVEAPLERVVALLGIGQCDAAQLFFFRIVVEIDVLAAQHAPVKAAVLDLVLTEVAVLREQGGSAEDRDTG